MMVSEVMHKGVSTAQINDSLKKVAALMKREDIGAVPIFKNERPVGFVTDRDIVVSCIAEGHDSTEPISVAMTRDIVTVRERDDLDRAMALMEKNQISRLLVIDEGENPVGMLSLQDISRVQSDRSVQTLQEIKRQ